MKTKPWEPYRVCCHVVLGALLLVSACGGGSGGAPRDPVSDPPPGGGAAPACPDLRVQVPADTGDGWEVAAPTGAGAGLQSMLDAIAAGSFPQVDAIVVARSGKLVFELLLRCELDHMDREVGNRDLSLHAQFSASKSLASTLVGVAIREGFLSGVDIPYMDLFDYPPAQNPHSGKARMRLRDVLTMRTGLQWNEWDPPYSDPDNQLWRFQAAHHDWSRALLDLPLAAEPGTVFAYNTIATTSLGQALANAVPLALADFASEYLLEPLGIDRVAALETPTALPDLGRGLFLRTRDMARFGQLMLDDGAWNGQQLLPVGWVEEATRAWSEVSWLQPEAWDFQISGYGYQWWLGYFELGDRRVQAFAAWGHGEQFTAVIPEMELVISVNARVYDPGTQDANQVFSLLRRHLLPAFTN